MSKTNKPDCEQVMNLFPNPFVVIGSDYTIVASNKQYAEQFGEENVIGQKCHKVSHHSDVPCSQNGELCPLEAVFNNGEATEVMHVHYDKQGKQEYVQLKAMPIFDDDGKLQYMGELIQAIDDYEDAGALLVGRSRSMMRMISLIQRVAPTQSIVLLQGESGVGKECVAQYIHQYSKQVKGPFIVLDCGNIGENLIESELFGYEKGAFTGATARKAGLFEAAQGGTLFIDEIGELPLSLQSKLLRVIETGTLRRVGGTEYIKAEVRVVAATHRNLKQMVDDGQFRQDLYYRLAAFPIHIPSLRERKDDIFLLSQHFLNQFEEGHQYLPLSAEVIEKLMQYDYPGNVRELRNILERAVILAAGSLITTDHIIIENDSDNNFGSVER
ncbi:MAG: sigma 54-interacting transcriptional regulator, partial [Gammaproteobacteria bacterium]|nr:sigma 54-interacting transcriptional regulator [Gammaproteobacteria bacterium]